MINELRLLAEDLHSLSGTNKYATAMSEAADEIEHLRQERDALAAQVVQMREALELTYNLDIAGSAFYDFENLREEALAIDTKPAESAINAVKAQVFW